MGNNNCRPSCLTVALENETEHLEPKLGRFCLTEDGNERTEEKINI